MRFLILQIFVTLGNLVPQKSPLIVELILYLLCFLSGETSFLFNHLIELVSFLSLNHSFSFNVFYSFDSKISNVGLELRYLV